MRRVDLTRSAEEDLLAIATWIAAENPGAAVALLDRFDRAFQLYAEQPQLAAHFAPRPQYRHFVVGNYVVFFEPHNDGIRIARVVHGARSLSKALGIDE